MSLIALLLQWFRCLVQWALCILYIVSMHMYMKLLNQSIALFSCIHCLAVAHWIMFNITLICTYYSCIMCLPNMQQLVVFLYLDLVSLQLHVTATIICTHSVAAGEFDFEVLVVGQGQTGLLFTTTEWAPSQEHHVLFNWSSFSEHNGFLMCW